MFKFKPGDLIIYKDRTGRNIRIILGTLVEAGRYCYKVYYVDHNQTSIVRKEYLENSYEKAE